MAAIKDIINQVIGDMSGAAGTSNKDLSRVWQELSGQGTSMAEFKDGMATVHVDSAVRVVHLNARRGELLKALQERCPQVKQLKFKVGKISNHLP